MTEGPQRWVAVGALALVLGAAFAVLRPFLVPMTWAMILAFVSWPVFVRLERLLGGRTTVAAGAMTLLVVGIVVVPAILLGLALAQEIQGAVPVVRSWLSWDLADLLKALRGVPWVGPRIADLVAQVPARPGAIGEFLVGRAGGWAAGLAAAAGDVGRNLLDILVVLLTLFFFYRDGARLALRLDRGLARLGDDRTRAMAETARNTVRAVMYGTLLTAPVQGLLALVGYWAAGLHAPVLLGALTALLALAPVGAPLVYVSAGIYLMVTESMAYGALLLAWGVLVVSSADNVIRSWFLKGGVDLPFLLAVFGVVGGVAAFGFIGLFLGPIAMTLLVALLREWTDGADEPPLP